MNFLQFWGDEHQHGIDAWFENLLRETTNLTERQACDAFGFLLHAGSPADAWYEDLHDNIRLRWPSLVLAFTSVWPVSKKLLCASGALHARRMERKEEQARVRDEEVLRAVEQELRWATEEEDYMWWAYLEEKKRLALDVRREAALDEDWAEFEEWERSVQATCGEDERAEREYEAQETAREEEDLVRQAEEQRLEEERRASMAILEAEGRRAAEGLGAARVRRVEGILRVVAEVEDRRRQEAMMQRTTAQCERQPLYTTPITSTMLAVPPNAKVTYPPPPETIPTDIVEPTAKKPPDGWSREATTSDAAREPAERGEIGVEGERIVDGRAMNAGGLTSHSLREPSVIDDRPREIIVLPPTKHPGTIPPTLSITYRQPHDDERPPAIKHPTKLVRHPHQPRERSSCGGVVRLRVTDDLPALTKHPTAALSAISVGREGVPLWVARLVRSLRLNDFSIVIQSSSHTNERPTPTKYLTTRGYAPSIVFVSTVSPFAHVATRSARFVQPPLNDDRPAAVKHPTTRENASLIVIPPAAPPFGHDESPKADDRPAPTKHPTMVPLTSSVTSHHPPPLGYDPPALTKHPGTGPAISITDLQLHNDERSPTTKHPTNLASLSREPSSCTIVVRLLARGGCPALTKHPTTRANATFVAIVYTVSPFVHAVTRSARFVQPPPNDDRPQAVKHPTALSWTVLVIKTRPPWFTGGLTATIALTGEHELALDRPALTKHPRTLNNALSIATPPTSSSTNDLTRSSDSAQPLASGDRPTPIKHPATTRQITSSILVLPILPCTLEATRSIVGHRPSPIVDKRPAATKHPPTRSSPGSESYIVVQPHDEEWLPATQHLTARSLSYNIPVFLSPRSLSSLTLVEFNEEHPYRTFHAFISDCQDREIAPLSFELCPSPDMDEDKGLLLIGIFVKQMFSIDVLAQITIHGQKASQGVIAAGTALNFLSSPRFTLHRFTHYGVFCTNRLLASCLVRHPSRRILPSPPRAYAYTVQRATLKVIHVTAGRHPLHRLRPLQVFRKSQLAPQVVPVRTPESPNICPIRKSKISEGFPGSFPVAAISAPILAPTLAWRHTDAKGRMLLATSFFTNNLPENHNADHFGAVLRVDWTAMRPRRLHLPISLRLPAREFSYAARVFSGHCVAPAYLGSAMFADQDWFSPACECGDPRGSSAHIVFECPLRHIWAPGTSTIISQDCSAPASLPGGGTQTAVSGPLVWLPHGFNWRRVPTTPEYQSLRDALALYALHHEEILPSVLAFELERTLPASTPYYPVSMAYLDYRRLRQAYFNSNAVLGPEHFLCRYLASHEVQYVPELGSRQPDRRPVVYVPPHFI
ncbi:hypothetical protein BOTBODRAFT_191990 [Botryobasidium botryosum FD-172 SS1]|uniref:Uncharacterized protein n=1 Tax=Botryobasidium botryosum (strain FD-172 SS1) TaxID=930990 RepID=A0A067LY14_BOTB1|nr:hypothetical protein BOTBODRAFT_191990 [Botryobasidium botryosum FD-172 SS1]